MRIVCTHCAASYDIKPEALGPSGRTVRCAACGATWFAAPPAPDAPKTVEGAVSEQAPIAPPSPASAEGGIEAAAARRRKSHGGGKDARKSALPGGEPPRAAAGLFVLALLIGAAGGAVHWRETVVRHAPETARLFAAMGLPVNLRGLEFREVTAAIEFDAGLPVTIVEGRIDNVTDVALAVPRLRLAVRAGDGRELMSWAASAARPMVGPRESVPFRSRLGASVLDGADIEVRFLGGRDARRPPSPRAANLERLQ